ncbi:hypothetical protein LIER_38840 [Lithospermum erythrorhizon]|uniref:Uncharacterized protein n=1 Tax=Lithospermum erythrorhizon TaxID=34254 RepID=A0AAV3QAT7_LITER
MCLNENYDAIKDRILIMEPWPIVSKAYSMVAQVKKKSSVAIGMSFLEHADGNSVMFGRSVVDDKKVVKK